MIEKGRWPFEPYTSPPPPYRCFDVGEMRWVIHAARAVQWVRLDHAGVPWWERALAVVQGWRLRWALRRHSGTWRYRVRLVRRLRADVGLVRAAPLRALVDHARRIVYFDFDRYARKGALMDDPALLDEARHIRERLGRRRRRTAVGVATGSIRRSAAR